MVALSLGAMMFPKGNSAGVNTGIPSQGSVCCCHASGVWVELRATAQRGKRGEPL